MAQEKVFPSAGHSLLQGGAVYKDRKEAKEMIKFRDAFIAEAKKIGVDMSKPDGDYMSNIEYARSIKTGSGSVLANFHMDAAPNNLTRNGTAVFIANDAPQATRQAAKELAAVLSGALGTVNLGVKTERDSQHSRIGILHGPGIRVLPEIIFITNDGDWQKWTLNYLKAAAAAARWSKDWDAKF